MKFYKEKLSRRVRWPIGVICFLWSMASLCSATDSGYSFEACEQYAPTLRANSARIEGVKDMISASGILPNPKLFVGLENYPISVMLHGLLLKMA